MPELTEIRWHARAGQGAKTASQMLALALLKSGRSVQAFPEYGPERRGAPLRAYTRISDRPIRRHDSVEHPDVVVVLEPSLVREAGVTEGLEDRSFVLLNADIAPAELDGTRVVCVPASRIAAEQGSWPPRSVSRRSRTSRRRRSSCWARSCRPTPCGARLRRGTNG